MAKNGFFKALKNKLVLILSLVCVFSFSMFCFVACGDDDSSSSKDPTYTYTQTDDGTIKNANFDYGTVGTLTTGYPKTSTTGWTRSTHNSAPSSLVNSGTIKVTDTAWVDLMTTLSKDGDFKAYLESKGLDLEAVKTAIKAEKNKNDYKPTDTDIAEYIAKNEISNYFVNPGKSPNASDNNVYMLNNYVEKDLLGSGTAQRLTSSSTISLEKDSYAKISVWVKTQNIVGQNAKGDYGANIVLTSKFNSTSQAEFRISNIIADDWTEYVVYVKADKNYTCDITLNLGLGYGRGYSNNALNFTEGTVYFDNITYEVVDNVDGVTFDGTKNMVFGSEDELEVKSGNTFLYNMEFEVPASYFTTLDFSNDTSYYYLTKSNVNGGTYTSETIVNEANAKNPNNTLTTSAQATANGNKVVVNLENSSYTLKIDNNGANFKLNAGNFTYLSFEITNNLSSYGSTAISFDVFEVYKGKDIKRPAVATFNTVSDEAVKAGIVFKNNFTEGEREFYVNVVIGPASLTTVTNIKQDLTTGTVTIDNLQLKDNVKVPEEKDDAYTLYDFYTNLASANVALYSGFDQDYTEDEEETVSAYSFTTAPGDVGNIYFHPVDVKGYYGVTPEHAYMSNGLGIDKLNTRSSMEGENGSYAGIINSKFVKNNSNYPIRDLILSATENSENKDVQALMIYNANEDSYGYIGETVSVLQSSLANVSVKIKVVGENTFANVYLVDTTLNEKKVLTFNDFTVNNNLVNAFPNGTQIDGSSLEFAIKVTEDMCDEDGWATVNFYIGAGKENKDFRVEIWNGTRDASADSQGMVLVQELSVTTATAFYEPERYEDAFSVTGNPLFDAYNKSSNCFTTGNGKLISYTRELTKTEKEFNNEYPDQKVTYSPKYVWAQTDSMIYAIYNTIDPIATDPYANVTEDETTTSGCTTTISEDPSAFWLGFSSIALSVVLVLAIVALFIKNYRRRHSYDNREARSHYTVKTRTSYKKNEEKSNNETVEDEFTETEQEFEKTNESEPEEEKSLDDYVYGDVEDFGETEDNSAKPSEESDDNK